jgi:hypothetical protein
MGQVKRSPSGLLGTGDLNPDAILAKYSSGGFDSNVDWREIGAMELALEEELMRLGSAVSPRARKSSQQQQQQRQSRSLQSAPVGVAAFKDGRAVADAAEMSVVRLPAVATGAAGATSNSLGHAISPGQSPRAGGLNPLDDLVELLAAAAPGQNLQQLLGEELAAALGLVSGAAGGSPLQFGGSTTMNASRPPAAAAFASGQGVGMRVQGDAIREAAAADPPPASERYRTGPSRPSSAPIHGNFEAARNSGTPQQQQRQQQQLRTGEDLRTSPREVGSKQGGYPVHPSTTRESYTERQLRAAGLGAQSTTARENSGVGSGLDPEMARLAAMQNMGQWHAEGGYIMRSGVSPVNSGADVRTNGSAVNSREDGGPKQGSPGRQRNSRLDSKAAEAPRRLSQYEEEMAWRSGLRKIEPSKPNQSPKAAHLRGEKSPLRTWAEGDKPDQGGAYGDPRFTAECEGRFEQLYKRAIDWRQKREMRQEHARREREQAETAACTFAPRINKVSNKLFKVGGCRNNLRDDPMTQIISAFMPCYFCSRWEDSNVEDVGFQYEGGGCQTICCHAKLRHMHMILDGKAGASLSEKRWTQTYISNFCLHKSTTVLPYCWGYWWGITWGCHGCEGVPVKLLF